MFLDTVFKEVIYQILGKSPLKFSDFSQLNNCTQTRARSLECYVQNLLDLTANYNRLALKCSSFTIVFSANSLFPENLEDMSKSQLNSYLQNTKRKFVTDNFFTPSPDI